MVARRRHHLLVAVLISELSGSRASALLPVCLLAAVMAGCVSAPAEGPTPPPPADGPLAPVYTAAQARRGQGVFTNVCATCHARNEFTGPIFALTWRAEPLAALYEHISLNMPQDQPGSLTPEQYIDVVSYILELNGIQAGSMELMPDRAALARIDW